MISREIEALRNDREYRKGWKGRESRPFAEVLEDMERYPSIFTRLRRFKNQWMYRLSWPTRTRREIAWFIQRGRRGYSDFDLYEFDKHLASVISTAVQQMKVDTYSYPPEFEEWEEWNDVLDQIAHGFETYLIWRDRHTSISKEFYMEALRDVEEEVQVSSELLGKWFRSLQV